MPDVVAEGRKVVNNLERSGSLFIVKNIFSLIIAILSICFGMKYPLMPSQISLISVFTIGLPAFFLSFMPNRDKYESMFSSESSKKQRISFDCVSRDCYFPAPANVPMDLARGRH